MTNTTQTPSVEEMIASMLTENTGIAMMDSGGDSGRMWQRNQAAVGEQTAVEFFESRPRAKWLGVRAYPHPNHRKDGRKIEAELIPVVDVYHWLVSRIDAYMPEMQAEFDALATTDEFEHEGWLAIMEAFPKHWAEVQGDCEPRITGMYDQGEPFTVNTYNGEDALSQTLQYTVWEYEGESYVALQIHGGADVRGGYTAPKIFNIGSDDGVAYFLMNADATCTCDQCGAGWYTDDANNWYGCDYEDDIKNYPVREGNWVDAMFFAGDGGVAESMGNNGTVVIEEVDDGTYGRNNKAWCPCCGKGNLVPGFNDC